MPVSEIHHVALVVRDLERSVEFYQKGLGYRPTLRMNVGGATTERALRLPPGTTGRVRYLQGPSQLGQLELIEWDGERAEPSPGAGHDALGMFLMAFEVPREEMDGLHERLSALGGTCYTEPTDNTLENYGPISAFVAEDPDGNRLEFVALPTPEQVRAFRAGGER